MLPLPAGREASAGSGATRYARHRPERTLLYQLVQEYYPALKAHLAGTVSCGCAVIAAMRNISWPSVGRSCASLRPWHS